MLCPSSSRVITLRESCHVHRACVLHATIPPPGQAGRTPAHFSSLNAKLVRRRVCVGEINHLPWLGPGRAPRGCFCTECSVNNGWFKAASAVNNPSAGNRTGDFMRSMQLIITDEVLYAGAKYELFSSEMMSNHLNHQNNGAVSLGATDFRDLCEQKVDEKLSWGTLATVKSEKEKEKHPECFQGWRSKSQQCLSKRKLQDWGNVVIWNSGKHRQWQHQTRQRDTDYQLNLILFLNSAELFTRITSSHATHWFTFPSCFNNVSLPTVVLYLEFCSLCLRVYSSLDPGCLI